MRHFMGILVLLALSQSSYGDLVFGLQNEVSVFTFQTVSRSIDRAKLRPDDMKNRPIYYGIFEHATLCCPPKAPDNSGEGCYLIFHPPPAGLGVLTVSIKKSVSQKWLDLKTAELSSFLEAKDPASTSEHLHIDSPLSPALSKDLKEESYVSCEAKVQPEKSIWICSLHVVEAVEQNLKHLQTK